MLVVGFFENSLKKSAECGRLVALLGEEGLPAAVEQAATYRLTVYLEKTDDPPTTEDRDRIGKAFRRFRAQGMGCDYLAERLAQWEERT